MDTKNSAYNFDDLDAALNTTKEEVAIPPITQVKIMTESADGEEQPVALEESESSVPPPPPPAEQQVAQPVPKGNMNSLSRLNASKNNLPPSLTKVEITPPSPPAPTSTNLFSELSVGNDKATDDLLKKIEEVQRIHVSNSAFWQRVGVWSVVGMALMVGAWWGYGQWQSSSKPNEELHTSAPVDQVNSNLTTSGAVVTTSLPNGKKGPSAGINKTNNLYRILQDYYSLKDLTSLEEPAKGQMTLSKVVRVLMQIPENQIFFNIPRETKERNTEEQFSDIAKIQKMLNRPELTPETLLTEQDIREIITTLKARLSSGK